MATLPFALYAGRLTIEINDKNRRGEHGSIDEALAALGWLQRQEQLEWAAVVNVESDEIAWKWEAEKSVKPFQPVDDVADLGVSNPKHRS